MYIKNKKLMRSLFDYYFVIATRTWVGRWLGNHAMDDDDELAMIRDKSAVKILIPTTPYYRSPTQA